MSDSSNAVAVRQNGTDVSHAATKAVWAGAGSNALSPEVARALALVGERYQLDPALGELMILGNRVYVTLEGYLRVAEQHPAYDGYELWPLGADERKALKVADDEHAYGCRVWRKDRRFPSVGYGVASPRSVQANPIQPFLREVAEKRAIHRAHRMAFRVGLPDAQEAIDEYERSGSVGLPVIEQGTYTEKAPAETPQPDWATFWAHIKGLGVDHEEAHKVLGVGSVRDWAGSLDEAVSTIERYVLARDQAPSAPTAAPAKVGKPSTRDDMIRRYRMLIEKGEGLGLADLTFDGRWSDDELRAAGKALAARVKAEEDRLFPEDEATTSK